VDGAIGAIGMAYGLTGTSVMLSFGIPPATASASVHAAEVFTTGVSALSHWRFGNVKWSMLWPLAVPDMIGGAVGAYLLTTIPGDVVVPLVSAYLPIRLPARRDPGGRWAANGGTNACTPEAPSRGYTNGPASARGSR
jgi:uncharacterized membrane protein YfcA